MNTVCELNKCSGCMACVDLCPKAAINIIDNLTAYNAVITEAACIHCDMCNQICQKNNTPQGIEPIKWYQGWAKNEIIRKKSSSGGLATAIAIAFVENGGVVCSCIFDKGKFIFRFAETVDDVKRYSGSKYVKSNPSGIYKHILTLLHKQKKVLFIGLPCQVAAVKKVVGDKLGENLFLADLICHGTPSPNLLNLFFNQYDKSLDEIADVQFRSKAKMQVESDNKAVITKGVSDKYTIAFLKSLTYTEGCYECDYAKKRRVSDITLGDSWGSDLPVEEKEKGISLVLCQTKKGLALVEWADLHLEKVDLDNAIENNQQLKTPSKLPREREMFFIRIENGNSFNNTVFKAFPKQCMRQNIKEFLIKMKMIR